LKKYTIILIMLSLVVLSACEDKDTIILPGAQPQNQMRVVGTATVNKSPDIAIAQIGVLSFSKEVEAAVAENNEKSGAIIDALKQHGVAQKDIQTTSFNIYPQWDYQKIPNEIVGFQVNNMVSVTFRDLSSIGKGLQRAIDAGANNIYGITFTLADPEPVRNEVRTLAIQDARKKAESIAQAAGIELGKLISVNELSVSGPIIYYKGAEASRDVSIEPGELAVTVQVELIFLIP